MGVLDRFRHQAQGKGQGMSGAAEREVGDRAAGTHEDRADAARQTAGAALGTDRDRPAQR
ncbi:MULTISPECIES: antitoxin [unclassified Streptomyces]|uniref:antitoxin n=1 Tax=unclassified Streptomyces TaxID=2593676 RepID=UPI001F04BB78|nr:MULTISPECIES: antitoxin [unclassified Streptomyces]MCH0564318.1 antitoxin [Streptomyces sp. MUM 2J]MCH0569489.1 antitoxin [Streptomyces sp. MUM 136J]